MIKQDCMSYYTYMLYGDEILIFIEHSLVFGRILTAPRCLFLSPYKFQHLSLTSWGFTVRTRAKSAISYLAHPLLVSKLSRLLSFPFPVVSHSAIILCRSLLAKLDLICPFLFSLSLFTQTSFSQAFTVRQMASHLTLWLLWYKEEFMVPSPRCFSTTPMGVKQVPKVLQISEINSHIRCLFLTLISHVSGATIILQCFLFTSQKVFLRRLRFNTTHSTGFWTSRYQSNKIWRLLWEVSLCPHSECSDNSFGC